MPGYAYTEGQGRKKQHQVKSFCREFLCESGAGTNANRKGIDLFFSSVSAALQSWLRSQFRRYQL